MITKIKNFVLKHKIVSVMIILILVIVAYLVVKNIKNKQISYETEKVKIGNITTTVTGTGQIESSNSIDITSNVSGKVNFVGVSDGDFVKKGKLIASVDCRDQANSLTSAKLSLEKLTSSSSSTYIEKENSLNESYNTGWNKVASYITDTTTMIDNIDDIYDTNNGFLGNSNISSYGNSTRSKQIEAESSFDIAKNNFDKLVIEYKSLTSESDNEKIKKLIEDAYNSSKEMSVSIKTTESLFNYVVSFSNYPNSTEISTNRENVSSWVSSSNNYVNSLLTSLNGIKENNASFYNNLDIKSAELSVKEKQDAYNDCFAYAPFDGVITNLNAKVGETSSTFATLITKQKIATVSFNEVDVASISKGQKTNLTFDAIPNLTIEGEVIEIDSAGTVTSGVVNYKVKIALKSDDERIKPGMSVNVEIITNHKENILTISSASVKTRNDISSVSVLKNGVSIKQEIVTGISDDSIIEVVSGLSENDEVITKTIIGNTSSSKTSNSSSLNKGEMMGGPMGGSAMGGVMH